MTMFILYQRAITLEALTGTFGQVLNERKVSVCLMYSELKYLGEILFSHSSEKTSCCISYTK